MFFGKRAVLRTPHKHTEVMRLLQDSFKGINLPSENTRQMEGYTTFKKFEIRIHSWPLSRTEHPYAMGVVEEDGSGSLIRLKMWMNPIAVILVIALNLLVLILIVNNLVSSFEWGKLKGLAIMLFPIGVSGIFYLQFLSEFRMLSRNLCEILTACRVKE